MNNLLRALVVFMLLPAVVLAQEPLLCEFEYTVQAGDWLSKIAEKYYGDPLAYDQLVVAANANDDDAFTNIDNPDLIEPGWMLCIPPDGDAGTGPQPVPERSGPDQVEQAGFERMEPAAETTVSGTITYLQRIALPPNAVVKVQLQDTSLADAPATVIGEQIIPTNGQQVPIPFEVVYNPDIIEGNHTYTLRVRIEDATSGQLLFINTTAYPVITNDNPTSGIEVVVEPVG
jgi:uncharacterized lipoprotein YbaY